MKTSTSQFRQLSFSLLMAGFLFAGTGCKKAATPATQYAIRNQDGSITNPDGSVTYPAGVTPPASSGVSQTGSIAAGGPSVTPGSSGNNLAPLPGPVPSASTSSTPSPAAAPIVEAPRPAPLTAPRGTALVVRLNGGLSASRNEVDDHFSGVLERAVLVHGATIFATGTPVSGVVVASKGKGRFKGAGALGIELTAIGREHVSTSEYERTAKGRGKRTTGFIAGGGGLGALIGGLAGGGKGALIGGLAGAGAGTAAGAYTGSRDVVIPAESVITFRLTQPLTH